MRVVSIYRYYNQKIRNREQAVSCSLTAAASHWGEGHLFQQLCRARVLDQGYNTILPSHYTGMNLHGLLLYPASDIIYYRNKYLRRHF